MYTTVLDDTNKNLNFLEKCWGRLPIPNFIKVHEVFPEIKRVDRETDGHYLPAVLLQKMREHICPPQMKHLPGCTEHGFLH
jgi:hypothetical protein